MPSHSLQPPKNFIIRTATLGMDKGGSSPIHLGFCEPVSTDDPLGHLNPDYSLWDGGQVGGKPSWLCPLGFPAKETTICSDCQTPLRFILQFYAPIDDLPQAYHRSLYTFACSHCNKVAVWRCQLPQKNDFFPFDLDAEVNLNSAWDAHLPETHNAYVCTVCGVGATAKCPLQQQFFCCTKHQKEYKRHGDASPSVYPVYELVVEEEPPQLESDKGDCTTQEVQDDSDDEDADLEQDDLNRMTGTKRLTQEQDATTQSFYHRLSSRANVQEQVVRYSRWQDNDVLWLHDQDRPDRVPDCPYCQSPRKFEFQIMPQLLHYLQHKDSDSSSEATKDALQFEQFKAALEQTQSLKEQAPPSMVPPSLAEAEGKAIENVQKQLFHQRMDWGVVAVYTCSKSCGASGAYQQEYAWRQSPLD